MIKGIVQGIESVRKGVTLKVDIDDAVRPDDIAAWQDEAVVLTNGKNIVEGELWKIQTTTDQCVRLSVDIPRDCFPDNIFTWKHESILIKKESDNGDSEEETGSEDEAQRDERRKVNGRPKGRKGRSKKVAAKDRLGKEG